MAFIDGVISPSGAGGGGGVDSYLNYGSLPGSASDGDWATTSDDGRAWRYHTIAGLWMPAHIYSEGPAFLNDGTDDANWTPSSTAVSLVGDGFPTGSWPPGTGTFSDSGGQPQIEVPSGSTGRGVFYNNYYSGKVGAWTPPSSDRYLVILDWTPITGAHVDNICLTMRDGAVRADLTAYYGALGTVGWTVSSSMAGAGGCATSAGTPFFIIFDLSAANATSSVIVPGQRTTPTIQRSDMAAYTSERFAGILVSGAGSSIGKVGVDRLQIFTL